MTRYRRPLLLLAALLACAASPTLAQSVRATGLTPAQTDSILGLARASDELWNAGDAAGLTALWAPEGHNRIVGTDVDLQGQAAIRAYFTQSFARRQGQLRHRTVVEELQSIAPGVVAADGQVWVELVNADASVRPLRHFTMHSVVVRTAEGWRMRLNRVHPDAAPAPQAAAR